MESGSDRPLPGAGHEPGGRHRRPAGTSTNDLRWWWNRATKTILGVGALATAVGAVLTLFASHATTNSAHFTSVQLISRASLSQFEQRSTAAAYSTGASRPGRARLAAQLDSPPARVNVAPSIGAVSPVTTPADSTPPVGPSEPAGSPGATAPGSSPPGGSPSVTPSTPTASATAPPALGHAIPVKLPAHMNPRQSLVYACDVAGEISRIDPGVSDMLGRCQPGSPIEPTPETASVVRDQSMDGKGNPLPVDVAARRIAGVLGHTQTTTAGPHQSPQPVGELVSVNLELTGLKDQPVFLSWSIYQAGGKASLYGNWLNNFAAYRLQATTDDDTGSVLMWVPLPTVPGPYFLRLTLSDAGASLASDDTGAFG